jgi:hypothetical protein
MWRRASNLAPLQRNASEKIRPIAQGGFSHYYIHRSPFAGQC